MDNYSISGNKIIFEAGKVIAFDFPISKTLVTHHVLIVLLDISGKVHYNQNILAVSLKGEILWQIEKSAELDKIGHCPFISIDVNKTELVCFNWCGYRFTVNPANGRITSKIFTK